MSIVITPEQFEWISLPEVKRFKNCSIKYKDIEITGRWAGSSGKYYCYITAKKGHNMLVYVDTGENRKNGWSKLDVALKNMKKYMLLYLGAIITVMDEIDVIYDFKTSKADMEYLQATMDEIIKNERMLMELEGESLFKKF